MNVTRENFSSIYQELKEKIHSCSFMAIDEEMTGIMNSDYREQNKKTDNPDQRYARMVPVASIYGIIQFGLCLFHEVALPGGGTVMEASPYNFYLFSDSGADITISASSIGFLRKNKMDFGTWITKGLNYANQNGEFYLRKKYLEESPAPGDINQRIVLTKESDIVFLTRNRAALDAFIADESVTEFVFEKCNSYLRRVLYQLMEVDYPSLKTRKAPDDRLQVLKLTEEAWKEMEAKTIEDGKKSFEAMMGFRLVFLDMIAAKKPMIGHNCLFDFMFMMRWLDAPFKEGKMETLTDFKSKFNGYFPTVFDTKYIQTEMESEQYADTSLGELYQKAVVPALAADNFLGFASGFEGYYTNGGQFHDAGWDAYCTGALFCHQLRQFPSLEELTVKTGNKLFMMQSLFHIDVDPSKPNGFIKVTGSLLHVGNFGTDTKMDAILQIFITAGYELTSLSMTWIDGSSTFMEVNTADTPEEIILKVITPEGWLLRSYEEFIKPVVAEATTAESNGSLKRDFSNITV